MVEQDDVGEQKGRVPDGAGGGDRDTDDLEAVLAVEQTPEAFTDYLMVIYEEHPNIARAGRRVVFDAPRRHVVIDAAGRIHLNGS
jgi:hypothetical protein